MARNFLVDINLNKRSLIAVAIENLGAAPASPVSGQLYYDTADGCLKVRNASAWMPTDPAKVPDGHIPIAKIAAGLLTGLSVTLPITSTGGSAPTIGINAATTAAAGSMSAADKTKLDGVAAGATANATDAQLRDRATHTGTQAASTISNFDTQVRTSRLDQMAIPTAAINANSQKITGLGAPTAGSNDAARMVDVESAVQSAAAGIDAKPSVRVATTANIALTGTQTIDGVAVAAGNRVLVKNQTAGAENGPYVVAAGAWTRAVTENESSEVTPGAFWYVEEGTTQGKTQWRLENTGAITLGTTALTINQFGAANTYTAGDGITQTGNSFAVDPHTGILVDGNGVAVDPSYVVRKFSANVGDAAATVYTLTHNLNTRDVTVGVYTNSGAYEEVEVDVEHTTVNTVTLRFASAPALNAYRAVIHG